MPALKKLYSLLKSCGYSFSLKPVEKLEASLKLPSDWYALSHKQIMEYFKELH